MSPLAVFARWKLPARLIPRYAGSTSRGSILESQAGQRNSMDQAVLIHKLMDMAAHHLRRANVISMMQKSGIFEIVTDLTSISEEHARFAEVCMEAKSMIEKMDDHG